MNCPIDGTTLVISERSGIEIDYCPQCRGVWLDRGELDKIIERAAQYEQQTHRAPAPQQMLYDENGYEIKRKNDDRYPDNRYDDDDDRDRNDPRYRKRRSFLDDIFDVFD